MPPWHVLWDLVSATNGLPDAGPASVESETLPGGRRVLAAAELPTALASTVTLYHYSLDHPGRSACTRGLCGRMDPAPHLWCAASSLGVTTEDLGTIRRPDGEEPVTYQGKPLYLYSREKFVFPPPVGFPNTTGTEGNGNGLKWPEGGTFSVVPTA